MATAPQCALSVPSNGSRPADLKDLIAGLYGSQPPHTADAVPQKGSTISDENNKATAMGGDIQEIYDKLKDSSLPEGFFTEERPWKDVYISQNSLIVSKRII
ncbi:Pentatricopeptide repeat-containing protein [Zea mays]|uniref:Pentatricopeptide repeat-containing protein n=1 Tax=Zea mays TaxID=4577 RepID=A0A1D6HAX8_MAIZE|nr:Pentatricopeptide repeat-containing protein [Zea mays]